jgi:hypothetical protein
MQGEVVIHRGLLREGEAKALRAQERQGMQAGDDGEGAAQPTARPAFPRSWRGA